MMSGRQLLYMLYQHMATDASMKPMYQIADLAHLSRTYTKYGGPEGAFQRWEQLVSMIKPGDVTKSQLLNCLLTYLRDVGFMKEIVAQMRMMKANDERYTYVELRSLWQQKLQLIREDKNRAEAEKSLLRTNPAAPSITICRHWQNKGECDRHKNQTCKFSHPKNQRGVNIGKQNPAAPASPSTDTVPPAVKKELKTLRKQVADLKQGDTPPSAPAPPSKGAGKGKRDSSQLDWDRINKLCYNFLLNRCTRDNCRYLHDTVSMAEFAEVVKLRNKTPTKKGKGKTKSDTQGDQPKGQGRGKNGKNNDKGKGKGTGKAAAAPICPNFLAGNTCPYGDACSFSHAAAS